MSNRNFLRLIVVTSLIAVVSLSCFSIFSLSPSFTKLIIKNTEIEAIKVATHLAEMVLGTEDTVSKKSITQEFEMEISGAVKDFGLMKIKVFAPDGEIVYSTTDTDIGKINNKNYFHNIVARGHVFTKVVTKDSKSLEDQVVSVDVVETYVPIMHGKSFAGAFEAYFDITDKKNELDELLFNSHSLLLLIAAGLLLAVLVISFIAGRSFIKQEQAEEKVIKQSLDLQEKNSELSVLNDISRTLNTSLDLDTMLPKVLQTIVNKLGILKIEHKGGILSIDGERMEIIAHLGHPEEFMAMHENMTIHDCLCGLAARTGDIIISKNSNCDSRHTICYPGMAPHGHIIVPLASANKVIGVLYLYLPADIELDDFKKDLLQSIGNQIGLAIDNARLYGETRKMSLHDPLTGLANRRFMDINLQQAVTLAERYGKPLCVAMFDIDLFKKYNDTKGHNAGDKLLAMVAGKIAMDSRDSDMAARYGGEEFLLILPESDLNGARLAVDRIRQNIGDSLDVTISAGVALYKKGSSQEELIKAADGALYKAKENGRNRVECA